MILLKAITENNFEQVCQLKVADDHLGFVSTVDHSLAQAWLYSETAFPFAIYADDLLVGFVMLGYHRQRKQYTLWKFLIDERFQNKGYGKTALLLAIQYLIDTFKVAEIFTGVAFGNNVRIICIALLDSKKRA